MDDTPAARNGLEALLLEFHDRQLDAEAFARRLLDTQVFVPVRDERHEIGGFQASTQAVPLLLESDTGANTLILFSAPDRAGAFLAGYPGYSGGLLAEFSWVLRRLGADIAVSINPDQTPGFDLDPEMVAMVASLLPEDPA